MVLVSAVSTTVGIRTGLPLADSGGSTIRSLVQPVWLAGEAYMRSMLGCSPNWLKKTGL